jgi:hypothetical protein
MSRIQRFLDETGCILNENMMPDVTVMVPELEIDREVSKIQMYEEKCDGPETHILTEGGRRSYHGPRNSAIQNSH